MRILAPLLVLVAVAGCGGGGAPAEGGTAAPKPSGTPFPAIDMSNIEPGVEYTTRAFEPALRITLPEGPWKVESGDKPDHIEVTLEAGAPVETAGIGFHHMTKVFPPETGGVMPGDAVDGPDDFAAWLTGHPHLKATDPVPVEALGLKGVSIDVTVRSSQPRKYRDCGKVAGPHCVVMYVGGIEPLVYGSDTYGRFLVLEQPDGRELVVEQFVEPRRAFKRMAPILDRALAGTSLAG